MYPFSEADRAQLPFLQAAILSTKSQIIITAGGPRSTCAQAGECVQQETQPKPALLINFLFLAAANFWLLLLYSFLLLYALGQSH